MESSTAALGVSPHVAPTVRSKLHPRYKYYIPDAGLSRPATIFQGKKAAKYACFCLNIGYLNKVKERCGICGIFMI